MEVERVRQALDVLWHKYFSSSTVPGQINWRKYSHQDLWNMLHSNAKVGQVGEQSDTVDDMAMAALTTTVEVDQNIGALSHVWRGQAADNARATLDRHTRGGAELYGFVSSIANALMLAAQALSQAQRTMPAPVRADDATGAGGVAGLVLSGPPGWFGGGEVGKCLANQAAADGKEQAVAVMEAYERDLHGAYRQVTPPSTLPPGVGPPPDLGDEHGTNTGRPVIVRRHPGRTGQGAGAAPAAAQPPPAGSAAPGVRTDPAETPAGPTDISMGTSAASAAEPSVLPSDAHGAGGATLWRDLTERGGLPGLLSGGGRPGAPRVRAGRPGVTGLGKRAGGLPGIGASGAGSPDDEDTEHHNKMPHNQQLFAFTGGQVLAPPVIGDWSKAGDDD
ncbi:MAG: hypothetical protein ACJ72N_24880 [Labedaea sp.]